MKLTVCYGHVKVIVPCGEGRLDVKSLIEKATTRYRKATNKSSLDHVLVKCLQTEDGGILDADDIVSDICDDRDKLIAIYEETIRHRPENNGDSSSTSFIDSQTGPVTNTLDRVQPVAPPPEFQNDTSRQNVSQPQVAVIKTASRIAETEKVSSVARNERPWRSNGDSQVSSVSRGSSSASSTPLSSPDNIKDTVRHNPFDRNVNRKSLSVGHPLLYSWIDAQEKMNESGMYPGGFASSDQQDSLDKPLSPGRDTFSNPSTGDFDDIDDMSSSTSEEIELESDSQTNLGVKVQGYKNADGRELGLIVHEIKGKNGRNGTLNVADRITEVNGVDLRSKSNEEAEIILNKALSMGPVRLKRTRSHHFISKDEKHVSIEKPNTLPKIADSVILNTTEAPRPVRSKLDEEIREAPIEDPEDLKPAPKMLVGTKLKIELMKGKKGLGFSLTSRDVLTNGPSPVFVKNILANGAAIQDGRLHIGDQLLEVNGVDVSGKGQSKVVEMLKKTSGLVQLVINRESKNVPEVQESEEAMETVSNDSGISAPKDEIFAITIPLNNLGPAGLGISVKGKISGIDSCDLGIYIKSIIKGGAASKDGRLKSNDRILRIEDVSLEGIPNDKAMDTMRNTMRLAMKKGAMRIIVSRKAKKESPRSSIPMVTALPSRAQKIVKSTSSVGDKDYEKLACMVAVAPSKPKPLVACADATDSSGRRGDRSPTHRSSPKEKGDSRRGSGKFVSVSSTEIPVTQPSRTVIVKRTPSIERRKENGGSFSSGSFPTEKDTSLQKNLLSSHPPSYEETIKSRSSSNSDSSTKYPLNKKEEFRLSDSDLLRTMSTSSRFSVDSLMISPDALPFERDAFGRLSMSERKGRAHLDATKSDFYSKMKKYKSLEDISSFNKDSGTVSAKNLFGNRESTADDGDADIIPFHEAMKRTESLDTILSNSKTSVAQDAGDENQFRRGTATSSSTPWYAQRSVSPTALKLRSRSTAWNDSFRTAVDKTPVAYAKKPRNVERKRQDDQCGESTIPITLTSHANYDASLKNKRKSAGFFKGIGQLLKKGKQRKNSESREEFPRTEVTRPDATGEKRMNRPQSLNEDTMRAQRIEMNSTRLIEREKREKEERLAILQRELRNMEETEMRINRGLNQDEELGTEPQESVSDNQKAARTSHPAYGIAVQVEKRRVSNEQKSDIGLPPRNDEADVFPLTGRQTQPDLKPTQPLLTREVKRENVIAASHPRGEAAGKSQQRFLPTSQLFYYGHSSLPRKFTMNTRPKTTAANPKPSTGTNPKSSIPSNQKSSAYSIEAQTEIFKRANVNREPFDVRSSARSLRQSPTPADPSSITISHTAKV